MRSGQLYYFTNILAYFVYLAIVFSQIIPAGMAGGSTTAYTAFTNMMACRVFRGVALGSLENTPSQLGLTTAQIAAVMQLEPLPSGRISNGRYDNQY
ncbi:hypothetical protein FIBSPDRAFT_955141 [Athelia psychrophila]|nr:hypothetical protein FIBSPDRAFT_955141 [Fibularhizoctonia sp. CBS 109695]